MHPRLAYFAGAALAIALHTLSGCSRPFPEGSLGAAIGWVTFGQAIPSVALAGVAASFATAFLLARRELRRERSMRRGQTAEGRSP